MKKMFTQGLITLSILLGITTFVKAQDIYWREGFDNSTGNLNSASGLALSPSAAVSDTADHGIWTLYGVYRTTGSGCVGTSLGHIRYLKQTDMLTKPWLATPDVANGIKTLNLTSIGNNKIYTFQYTTGVFTDDDAAGVAGATWVTFTKLKIATTCSDTAIAVNQPLARRIRILNDTNTVSGGYQLDVDSIYLTSFTPVPVKFSGISANYSSGVVKVSWTNETELNTSSYEIERSADGKSYTSIGSVSATNVRAYSSYDYAPLSGKSYYRIKGVDHNGSLSYSSVASVNDNSTGVAVAPNPVKDGVLRLKANNLPTGKYTVTILSSGGQVVYSASVDHTGSAYLRSLSLPASVTTGLYTVSVTNGSAKFSSSVIVE